MDYRLIYDELIEKIKSYHPSNDFSLIEKAYNFAVSAHHDQFRKSGEPYIIHPLSVAVILADIGMDMETIAAGILHDVIEDTKYQYDDIVSNFGEEIALLVDGVTKLDNMEENTARVRRIDEANRSSRADEDISLNAENRSGEIDGGTHGTEPYSALSKKEELLAQNYRKMFLAMAKDIRVILIKMADRLHNLQTLSSMPLENQRAKAQETLDIYAPLAHRLGISKIRYELEDLSFRYLYPAECKDINTKSETKKHENFQYVETLVKILEESLSSAGIKATVEGRTKHNFSIYKKMVGQGKTFDQIYDLFAVRVLVDDRTACYDVLGITHALWKPIQGRFKDYISNPKPNMYQSLHTTLLGGNNEPFEVQIRTFDMHRIAEYGIAAHWKYKEGKDGISSEAREQEKFAWLRQILNWQRELDNKEYLDSLKVDLNIFEEHVYCFTPKGEVVSLLMGSTPVDFAFAIHSAVGYKMIGARVNGRIVTFDYALVTGDRVEIITSQNSKGPSKDWFRFIKTSQARNKINQWFKKENREENVLKGKELLLRDAKRKKLVLNDVLNEKIKTAILEKYRQTDWDSLCAAVGLGGIKEGHIVNYIEEQYLLENATDEPVYVIDENDNPNNRKKKSGIVVKDVGDVNVRFSKCCSPVPGDEIVAFVTRGRGISLHRTDCVNIINLDEMERHRLISAEWNLPARRSDTMHYRADLQIVADDRYALVADITRILGDEKIPIKMLNARIDDLTAVTNIGIEIYDRQQLDTVCRKFTQLSGVRSVERLTT